MAMIEPSVCNDPKISHVLTMLAQGKSREEIANKLGNKNWKTIDMYFRRKGFRWTGMTYEPRQETTTNATEEARYIQTKSAQVIRQLSQKKADIRQVAMKNGFPSIEGLGEYMKSNGYVWNGEANNYEYDESTVKQQNAAVKKSLPSVPAELAGLGEYQSLLEFLLNKKERLYELLQPEHNGTLPRYKFKGAKAPTRPLGYPPLCRPC